MRLARAQTPDGIITGTYESGSLKSENNVYDIESDADLLAPVSPSTLYCVGRNYVATLDQMEYERPTEPDFFIKPSVSTHPPRALGWYRQFREIVLMFAIINIEPLCEPL